MKMARQLALATALLICTAGAASAQRYDPLEFPPLCKCDRNLRNSPYRLGFASSSSTLAFNTYCFRVFEAKCDPTVYCCNNQPLYKFELDVGEWTSFVNYKSATDTSIFGEMSLPLCCH